MKPSPEATALFEQFKDLDAASKLQFLILAETKFDFLFRFVSARGDPSAMNNDAWIYDLYWYNEEYPEKLTIDVDKMEKLDDLCYGEKHDTNHVLYDAAISFVL